MVIDVIAADEPGLFAASVFALQDVQTGSLRQGEHLVDIGTDDDIFSAEREGGVHPAALNPSVLSDNSAAWPDLRVEDDRGV